MITNAEIRKTARMALEGNWGKGVLFTLFIYAIGTLCNLGFSLVSPTNVLMSSSGNILAGLLLLPLSWGFSVAFLKITRSENANFENLFDGYKEFTRIFVAMFLKELYTLLWTLLLIVPGIIKMLSYAMTEYILLDNPKLSADDAIHRSRVMMDGHKMKLFLLFLSFIGWAVLCLLTLGLGFLLLIPYINTSLATFYEDLKKEQNSQTNTEEPEEIIIEEA